MKIITFLALIGFLNGIISCSQRTTNVIEIEDYVVIDTDWGITRKVEFYENKYFVLDVSGETFIWVYDKTFNGLYSFAKKGNGPEELGIPETFIIQNNKIYILDKLLKSIKIFSLNGDYLDTIPLEQSINPVSFCIMHEKYYVTSAVSTNDFAIQVYDNQGNLINEFGKKNFIVNSMMDNIRNLSSIYAFENKIYQFPSFASSQYFIYNADELLLDERELNLPFEIIFNSNQKDIYEGNIGTSIFHDVITIENNLYALIGGGIMKQKHNDMFLCLLEGKNHVYYKINIDRIRDDLKSRYLRMTIVEKEIYIISPDWDFMIKVGIERLKK